MTIVIISSKGQIVIPKEIREMLGLIKGNKLKIFQENKKIILNIRGRLMLGIYTFIKILYYGSVWD